MADVDEFSKYMWNLISVHLRVNVIFLIPNADPIVSQSEEEKKGECRIDEVHIVRPRRYSRVVVRQELRIALGSNRVAHHTTAHPTASVDFNVYKAGQHVVQYGNHRTWEIIDTVTKPLQHTGYCT